MCDQILKKKKIFTEHLKIIWGLFKSMSYTKYERVNVIKEKVFITLNVLSRI